MAEKRTSGSKDESKAPWILLGIKVDLNHERESIAVVRTPEGDREVPMSEARDKVNIFEQLPEHSKQQFARAILEKYREWIAEKESGSHIDDNDKQ